MRTPSSLPQSSSFKNTSLLPPLQPRPRETCSLSWDISEHEFDEVQDTQKSQSAFPKDFIEYKLLGETGTSMAPYFLDKQ